VPVRSFLGRLWYDFRILLNRALGRKVTGWDAPSKRVTGVMSAGIRGVKHPSRAYVRAWLRDHPGMTLLDIPCGPGIEYEGIKAERLDVTYIGMDYTDSMLELFRSKFPEAEIRKGSILDIPLPDKSVDVVLARHILEHL
jgi:ubiquinone/menaquinone biosynthesis C-methylase UbiE